MTILGTGVWLKRLIIAAPIAQDIPEKRAKRSPMFKAAAFDPPEAMSAKPASPEKIAAHLCQFARSANQMKPINVDQTQVK